MPSPLLVARSGKTDAVLLPALANRHGLITGATGTGKTVTLQALAQQLSTIGVPVFMADVKGDLAGLAKPGGGNAKVTERAKLLGIEIDYRACPVVFWDVFAKSGHPVRATVSDMGPLLLSRMLGLNETQEGVLTLVFKIADDNGLLLLDAKDLRAMLQHVGDNAATFRTEYGNVSAASIGAIQRGLLALESQGAGQFFGEPMLDIADLIQTDGNGRGVVNVLAADKLMGSPKLYATFLLWMLAELFEQLPEVGDPEKPKLVFFFDEAHLLFNEAPKALLDKIEQVVRLIRSKGVGVYFVTQNPLDIPDTVLGQLGNRVQHALRAFTPRDQKAVKSAAETMRPNPKLKIEQAITELAVGEALVSLLDEKGRPTVTERSFIVPPGSQLGPLTDAERKAFIESSTIFGHYEKLVDRESAYEKLKGRTAQKQVDSPASAPAPGPAPAPAPAPTTSTPSSPHAPTTVPAPGPAGTAGGGISDKVSDILFGRTGPRGGKQTTGILEAAATSAARSIGSAIGRQVLRGVLGSIMGGKRR
jgi:DNA helicase HerA-like ATPase